MSLATEIQGAVRSLRAEPAGHPVKWATVITASSGRATLRAKGSPADGSRDFVARYAGTDPSTGSRVRILAQGSDVTVVAS